VYIETKKGQGKVLFKYLKLKAEDIIKGMDSWVSKTGRKGKNGSRSEELKGETRQKVWIRKQSKYWGGGGVITCLNSQKTIKLKRKGGTGERN